MSSLLAKTAIQGYHVCRATGRRDTFVGWYRLRHLMSKAVATNRQIRKLLCLGIQRQLRKIVGEPSSLGGRSIDIVLYSTISMVGASTAITSVSYVS